MGYPEPSYPVNDTWAEVLRWRNMLKKYVIGINGSLTWNPGDLADGGQETSSSITVTGAELGDFVLVSAPYDLQGIIAHGYVDAANSAKISIVNETGGNINLASGLWKVKVLS